MPTNKNIKPHVNQKIVTVNKTIADATHPYCVLNLEALQYAATHLEGNPFKVWLYFARNQNRYAFGLSPRDVERVVGVKSKAYTNAIKILEEQRYLVPVGGNYYQFFETPQSEP